VQSPTRRRIRNTVIILAIAALPGMCVYKYRAADESERRCGIVNLFKWDYSSELAENITFSADASDVRVDFTGLKRWKKVCLVEMYEEQINGPVQENPWEGLRYHRIGRWQCSAGNPDDAVTVALIRADGGTLARQIKFPERIRSLIASTYYAGDPVTRMYLAAGYRQCAPIEKAVARCAAIEVNNLRGCYLFFPAEKPAE
jgi:hypothetical protein